MLNNCINGVGEVGFDTRGKRILDEIGGHMRDREERKISHESACSVYMTAFNLLKNASLGCKQSCSILRYTANVIQENENKKRWITFRYEFPMPMRTILYEEYVIMDLMNVVGVIGGTFGMFIGLDFSGIIDILRDFSQTHALM